MIHVALEYWLFGCRVGTTKGSKYKNCSVARVNKTKEMCTRRYGGTYRQRPGRVILGTVNLNTSIGDYAYKCIASLAVQREGKTCSACIGFAER